MGGSAVLSYLVDVSEESLEEGHVGPVLDHLNESVFDVGTDSPGVVGSIGPLKVDPHFVVGDVFYLEVGLLFVGIPE